MSLRFYLITKIEGYGYGTEIANGRFNKLSQFFNPGLLPRGLAKQTH